MQKAESSTERRILSILFCDLVGSTPLSQQLDVEEFRAAMRSYEDAAVQAITKYGGYVARYIGDGIVAYFGWPQADEGQATQAVRAGLEAVSVVRQLKLDAGVLLRCRVGIASGQVVVGGEERKENAAGVTPNLAARLQTLAEPNQVVIDKVTRRLIGEDFRAPCTAAVALERVRTTRRRAGSYRGAQIPRSVRGASGRLGALCGTRQRDPGTRPDLAVAAIRTRAGGSSSGARPVLASPDWSGNLKPKIRSSDVTVLRYQCSPYHATSAFHPVIQHLEKAASFEPRDEPPSGKLEKIATLFHNAISEDARAKELLAALLSLPHEES